MVSLFYSYFSNLAVTINPVAYDETIQNLFTKSKPA